MAKELRVLVLKDGGTFVAQCLEIDIAAQGKSEAEALENLRVAFKGESELALAEGRVLEDIGPAPQGFHAVFASDHVSRDKMQLKAA